MVHENVVRILSDDAQILLADLESASRNTEIPKVRLRRGRTHTRDGCVTGRRVSDRWTRALTVDETSRPRMTHTRDGCATFPRLGRAVLPCGVIFLGKGVTLGSGRLQVRHIPMGSKVTYQEAGVDTRAAAALVGEIKADVRRTQQQRQLFNSFGLFAAAFDLSDYKNPVIVTGCDGVGTKLEVLLEHGMEAEAGKDLVAMSVNDIITTGGDPLMFLDYIGIEKLRPARIKKLISGMCDYLADCGCILAGGETAEMPGLVPPDVVELAGFCIGAVEKGDMIQPETVAKGDVLIGYASDSFHANGWSLIRRIMAEHGKEFSETEMRELLKPTRLYHDVTNAFKESGVTPKAYAHITGGGLPENLERLFRGLGSDLEIPFWENEAAQKVLAHSGAEDRFHTFNMGIGWAAVVSPEDAESACGLGPGGVVLGELKEGDGIKVTVKN